MKRIIGMITVKNNKAVQSFGYKRYLPIGKPEILAKNLDRWGVDEILVNIIDRTKNLKGPDYETIRSLKEQKLSTPIIYGGGINSLYDAKKVINEGADRILLETIILKKFNELKEISDYIGSQSIICSIPLSIQKEKIYYFNYLNKKKEQINKNFLNAIELGYISEVLLIDHLNEGSFDNFDTNIIKYFPNKNVPLITFGGIYSTDKINKILKINNVDAVAIGNSLNYSELSIQNIKKKCKKYLRNPVYEK